MPIHIASALRRYLQQFVEYDLCGVVRWDQCRYRIEPDSEGEIAVIAFATHDGSRHEVRVQASSHGVQYPNGQVFLDGHPQGPIDEATWSHVAHEIKVRSYGRRRTDPWTDGRRTEVPRNEG